MCVWTAFNTQYMVVLTSCAKNAPVLCGLGLPGQSRVLQDLLQSVALSQISRMLYRPSLFQRMRQSYPKRMLSCWSSCRMPPRQSFLPRRSRRRPQLSRAEQPLRKSPLQRDAKWSGA